MLEINYIIMPFSQIHVDCCKYYFEFLNFVLLSWVLFMINSWDVCTLHILNVPIFFYVIYMYIIKLNADLPECVLLIFSFINCLSKFKAVQLLTARI